MISRAEEKAKAAISHPARRKGSAGRAPALETSRAVLAFSTPSRSTKARPPPPAMQKSSRRRRACPIWRRCCRRTRRARSRSPLTKKPILPPAMRRPARPPPRPHRPSPRAPPRPRGDQSRSTSWRSSRRRRGLTFFTFFFFTSFCAEHLMEPAPSKASKSVGRLRERLLLKRSITRLPAGVARSVDRPASPAGPEPSPSNDMMRSATESRDNSFETRRAGRRRLRRALPAAAAAACGRRRRRPSAAASAAVVAKLGF